MIKVIDGWELKSADFELKAAGLSETGVVLLIRDKKGTRKWLELPDEYTEGEDRIPLHIHGRGETIEDAITEANKRASIATEIPVIQEKQDGT